MTEKVRRIGVLTGGGDCPGLNAVIRAVVKSANNIGWTVIGIKKGFEGLMGSGNSKVLDAHDIRGILNVGGTILGTTNRGDPFKYAVIKNGKTVLLDKSNEAINGFKKLRLDALVCIGGDGTLTIAKQLADKGIPLVGVPKTIDNDLSATVTTFGFDTAVSTATEALDKLHSTAESHQRVMVVEVMGRYAGWIALNSGIAGGADIILIPEIPFDMDKVCKKIKNRYKIKRNFCIVVAAEGAKPKGSGMFTKASDTPGRAEVLLGGIAEWVAKEIHSRTGKETRSIVLGHLQRGGNPTTFDRLLATRFGAAAIRTLRENKFGQMVCLRPPNVVSVPLIEAIGKMKSVPLDSDEIITGRNMGISFGD